MMKQAMSAMGSKPGASPFGAAGAMPPFGAAAAGGMPPFGGGMPPPPPGGFRSAPVDVPSTPVTSSSSSESSDSKKGDKFKANAGGKPSETSRTEASASKRGIDVVEPTVKEPSSNGSSSGGTSKPQNAFFSDVSVEETAAKAAGKAFTDQAQQQQKQGAPLDPAASKGVSKETIFTFAADLANFDCSPCFHRQNSSLTSQRTT